MKSHTIKLNQKNMLCHRCLLNVVQGLSNVKSVQGFDIDLKKKIVKVIYSGSNISREDIQKVVNESIINGVKRKS